MFYLLMDSSQLCSCVALVEKRGADFFLRKEVRGTTKASASESLLPFVDEVLKKEKISLNEVQGFGVGIGPGSFTGIRIGLATIRTLSQVLNKKTAALSSLRVLSLSLNPIAEKVAVKAYQGQHFKGYFQDDLWIEELAALIEESETIGEITGAGLLAAFQEKITQSGESSFVNYQDLQPKYLRPSQAEINLANKRAKDLVHES